MVKHILTSESDGRAVKDAGLDLNAVGRRFESRWLYIFAI